MLELLSVIFYKFATVTAHDLCQNLVFAQYLENEWTEFKQILYTHYHWQEVCWDCDGISFSIRVMSLNISFSSDGAMVGLSQIL